MRTPDSDTLMAEYQAELTYLRSAGAAFARVHPSVAAGLDLSQRASTDPHVERLIESFAFLTARLRLLYSGNFPEIPEALLGVLCPFLAAPVPSMAIAQFRADPEQARSAQGIILPQETQLLGATADGATCRFRTCYPVTLWPIEIVAVDLPALDHYPFAANETELGCALRVRLRGTGGMRFDEMAPERLRFCLLGERSTRYALFDLLAGRLAGLAILRPDETTPLSRLPADRVRPVGFDPEESVLPDPGHGHGAYRLLHEYATFPDKFMFFDVLGLSKSLSVATDTLDLLFVFDRAAPARLAVGRESLHLNCTPIINLFPRISEPIRLDHTRVEYRLIADSRFESSTEIHSITGMSRIGARGMAGAGIPPLFSFAHDHVAADGDDDGAMWIARRRRPANPAMSGSDMVVSFAHPSLDPARPAGDVVFAHTLCTNRGRAVDLPAGAKLEAEIDAPLRDIVCLSRPTPQSDPPAGGDTLWRLVSHLSLNRLSLSSDADGLAALREILLLYGSANGGGSSLPARALTGLSTRRVVRHVGDDAWRGFCRGLEVTLEIDEDQLAGGSLFLLGHVLDRFLALYVGGDAFTELVLTSRHSREVLGRWKPRTGDAHVL